MEQWGIRKNQTNLWHKRTGQQDDFLAIVDTLNLAKHRLAQDLKTEASVRIELTARAKWFISLANYIVPL